MNDPVRSPESILLAIMWTGCLFSIALALTRIANYLEILAKGPR